MFLLLLRQEIHDLLLSRFTVSLFIVIVWCPRMLRSDWLKSHFFYRNL